MHVCRYTGPIYLRVLPCICRPAKEILGYIGLFFLSSQNCLNCNLAKFSHECVALCKKDNSLQIGRFCISCIPRSSEDRSSRMFFIQGVRGRPGGRLQFSGGASTTSWLASAFSSVRARCPKKVRRPPECRNLGYVRGQGDA